MYGGISRPVDGHTTYGCGQNSILLTSPKESKTITAVHQIFGLRYAER
jgi:hypothetical protein